MIINGVLECPKCGAPLTAGSHKCGYCGYEFSVGNGHCDDVVLNIEGMGTIRCYVANIETKCGYVSRNVGRDIKGRLVNEKIKTYRVFTLVEL